MSSLHISQGTFRLSDTRTLSLPELTLRAGESWAFVGTNGSGKSALARALAGELTQLKGERQCTFTRLTRLSFEQLQKLVSDEWQRNNTDLLSPGEEDTGRTTAEIIQDEIKDPARCQQLAEQFGITALLNRRFKYLSTGETRKTLLCQALMSEPELLILDEPFDGLDVQSRAQLAALLASLNQQLLCQALMSEPELLILDEPFDGLDVQSRAQLAALLASLNQQGYTLVLVLNRFDEIPDFVHYAGVLADCSLTETGEKAVLLRQALIAQLAHSEKLDGIALPEPDAPSARHGLDPDQPRIVLRDGVVAYDDRPILNHLSWTVNPGEHWQIVGPNGAGKSTLLSLITGDHPQGYSNDLTLFGRRRGSGETIWDIKKHIGYVSSSLHLDYRVSTTVRNVILSGFFDSIGIYQAVSDKQHKLAQQWLDILGMDNRVADAPFHSLSWGQQRLALIIGTQNPAAVCVPPC